MGNETNSQKKGSTDAQTTKGVNRMGKCTKFIAIAAINETERAKADRERARESKRERSHTGKLSTQRERIWGTYRSQKQSKN